MGNYIVDFYCSNCQVVIEIDGSQHSDQAEYDLNRDQYLNSLGLIVIRIPASDVLYHMKGVMNMLYEHPELRERK
ncbi:endonuclease domain-containing protein [Dyadobacter jejuensis]|uniref:endonuclease domain-containing protein n=1 Tax=Dyadobacter jejuensis TaxID=1082580 RepID=UPI0035B5DA8A